MPMSPLSSTTFWRWWRRSEGAGVWGVGGGRRPGWGPGAGSRGDGAAGGSGGSGCRSCRGCGAELRAPAALCCCRSAAALTLTRLASGLARWPYLCAVLPVPGRCKQDETKADFWKWLSRREIKKIAKDEAGASQLEPSQAEEWYTQKAQA